MRQPGTHCKATKGDGTPCRAWAGDSGYCFVHDPAKREHAQSARSKAGTAKAVKAAKAGKSIKPSNLGPPPADREELRNLVAHALNWVISGQLDPKRADSVIKMAKSCMNLFPEAAEVDPHDEMDDETLAAELERELRAVKQRLATSGGNGHEQRLAEYASLVADAPGPIPGPGVPDDADDWPEVGE